MRYLLDTCVISELVARQPDPNVLSWIDSVAEEKLYLSAITIGEKKKGIEKLSGSARRDTLAEWLEGDLLIRFKGKILSIDTDVMLAWGTMVADLEKQGKRMPAIDSLIAAIALEGRMALVTRNVDDFAQAGVAIVNPWQQ
jgi:tRNA(fMet)-specific endonuclease VapC